MDSQPLTKKDLHEAMEEFASIVNTGFEGQAKLFDAKLNDLRNELNGNMDSLRNELNGNMDSLRNELNGNMDSLRNEVLESNEKIATDVHAMRQEQTAATGGRQRIDDTLLEHGDTLDDHSRRIGMLERKPAGA